MNDDLSVSWKQQLLMLKQIANASVVFLAQITKSSIPIVASTQRFGEHYSVSKQLDAECFGIDRVFKHGVAVSSENQSNLHYTAPVVLQSFGVWGCIVVLMDKDSNRDSVKLSTSTFCKTIGAQIELNQYKTNKEPCVENIDSSALSYLLKSIGCVPWRMNFFTREFTCLGNWAEQILGNTLEDWPDFNSWCNTIHPHDRERVKDCFFSMSDDSNLHEFEYRQFKKDGSVIWIRNVLQVVFDAKNRIKELTGVMLDITYIKEEEQHHQFLDKQLHNILLATNSVLSISNEHGDIIYHSHEDVTQIDCKCHQYIAKNKQMCIHCPRKKDVKAKSTFRYQDKGKTIQVEALPYEVKPNVWHMAEVLVDITDRVSNENELAVFKNRFDYSTSLGNIAYLEYNFCTQVLRTNKIFKDITGFVLKDGRVDLEWIKTRIHETDIAFILDSYAYATKTGEDKVTVEFRLLNAQNTYLWVRFSGQFQVNDQGISDISGVLIDLSDTKQLMDALLQERNKSMQASEAKSMFLANMSHEIRTPMNSIIGFSELLSKHIVTPPLNAYLQSIKASGNVLLALINDLLDIEKIEAGKMIIRKENTDFVALLNEIEQSFSMSFAEKGIDLLVKPQLNFPALIYVDSLKIKQMLLNLISNALKFTHYGEVLVTGAYTYNEEGNKGTLLIKVSDTGIGISKDKQDQIFDPFVQDKHPNEKDHQGTGLGLSIVQKLVRMMGGVVSLNSRENGGSTFSILIPDVEATNSPYAEMEGETKSDVSFNQESVLIVDNVATNRDVLCALCSSLTLKAHASIHGKAVIQNALKIMPQVIIADIRIPKLKGFDVFKEIKTMEQLKDIPIIAVSSSSNMDEEKLAMDVGFDGFISKPITEHLLIREIAKFIKPKEVIDTTRLQEDVSVINFTASQREMLAQQLDRVLIPLWQGLTEILSSEKLALFLDELKNVTEHVCWPSFEKYTLKMDAAIKSYDFETIQKLLNQFNILINELK